MQGDVIYKSYAAVISFATDSLYVQ